MADTVQRVSALNRIQESLAPLIGDNLARTSVKLHSTKLGLDGAELNRDQVNDLLTQIGLAMRVFVGAERADALIAEIQRNLFGGGA